MVTNHPQFHPDRFSFQACDNLSIKYGAKVKRYEIPRQAPNEALPKENVRIELEDGSIVETSLLVGADGFRLKKKRTVLLNTNTSLRSLVRQSIGSDYHSWDYPQMGLVATININTSRGPNTTAWQVPSD